MLKMCYDVILSEGLAKRPGLCYTYYIKRNAKKK